MPELFTNNAQSTLDGAINDSVTSLDVSSASSFPVSGDFRIKIDDEIMLVTAVSSNTFTVTRGSESTTAASHSSGATVSHVLTAAAIEQIRLSEANLNALLADTDTIDVLWANPGAHTFSVRTQNSLTADSGGIQLSGDSSAPGNNYFYSTNSSGLKGWNTASLDDLSDVTISMPYTDQVLSYNGSNWANNAINLSLDNLSDVSISAPGTNQVLTYNGSNWVNSNATSGAVDDLTDVTLSSPTAGQVLYYNGSGWINVQQNLDDLNDVFISSPSTGQIVSYNGSTWVNASPAVALSSLSDVSISSMTDNDQLRWNGSAWVSERHSSSYSADDESSAYSAQSTEDIAKLDDLNALRTAYENLRAEVEAIRNYLS